MGFSFLIEQTVSGRKPHCLAIFDVKSLGKSFFNIRRASAAVGILDRL